MSEFYTIFARNNIPRIFGGVLCPRLLNTIVIGRRPVESHSGARENIIAGPYPPILYVFLR